MRSLFRFLYRRFTTIYVDVFGRAAAQYLNDRLLQLALRAKGYNNDIDPCRNGEAVFIRYVSRSPPPLCVDVGATKGSFSELVMRQCPGAKIIAFEPLPDAFRTLQALAARSRGRLLPVNKGVREQSAELDLHYGSPDSELASFSDEVKGVGYVGVSNTNRLRVATVSLDDYFETEGRDPLGDGIDFLKIDTEGYEYEVLMGTRRTIARHRPRFIRLEFNWHQLFRRQSLYSLSLLLNGNDIFQLLPRGRGL